MILLKNCLAVFRPDGSAAGGIDILIEGNRITRIGCGTSAPAGAKVLDASRHVVLPGLVNTHHHFYQTLTRALPAVQDAKLFDWLVYLYEIWKGVDEDAVYWSSRLAMAELLKTGCTLTTDHHYLYPRGFRDDLPGIQFAAASDLGSASRRPAARCRSRRRTAACLPTRWCRTRTGSYPSARPR